MPIDSEKKAKTDTEKLTQIIHELPPYCMMFFASKADVYGIKTRIAYALDLKTFFWYLIDALPDRFPYGSLAQVPADALNELTPDDIVMYLSYLNEYTMPDTSGNYPTKAGTGGRREIIVYRNSPQGKKRKLASLKSFFKYMMVNRKLTNDPTVYVDPPKIHRKEIITMTDREEQKFKDAVENGKGKTERGMKFFEKIKYRDYAIAMLFLGTGVRISELCNMEMYDLDLEEQRILVIRKGGNQQFVYFKKDVLSALTDYLELERPQLLKDREEKNGPLFLSNRGTKISLGRVEAIIKEYGRQVLPPNTKISCHLLRKTCGSRIYNNSGDLPLTQHALGHADPSTTSKYYINFDENRLKKLRD